MAAEPIPGTQIQQSGFGTAFVIAAAGLTAGLAARYFALDHTTSDTFQYLLPWYEFVRARGMESLGHAFTNYTPFYSYLLLIATWFDGWLAPLHLIKAISLCHEFGCAILAARLVAVAKAPAPMPAVAFTAVWIAPTVLYNGALWGQADSIWTFYCLVSVYLLCLARFRSAVVAFAVAFAVKAQAVFLAPLIFAFVLRRSIHWAWLAAIPAVYFLLAAPAWLLGQSMSEVLLVYVKQSGTFDRLSMNAANLWLFADNSFYRAGVVAGMTAAAAAGLTFSVIVARSKILDTPRIILAAAIILLLMPFVLPKMHDRYFYAFEVIVIALACIDRRFVAVAIAAQLNGVLAYFAFDGITAIGLPLAAIGNTLIVILLVRHAWITFASPAIPEKESFSPRLFVAAFGFIWLVYGAALAFSQIV